MDKSSKQQRCYFIELIAYWEGGINTTKLDQQFSQSRQQSSNDINYYKNIAPNNLEYDSSQKTHKSTNNFSLQYISGDVDEYLHWFHSRHFLPKNNNIYSESLVIPARKISPQLISGLVTAMRQQKRIEVDYVSLNNPNREGRVIAPHSFVNTGLRWHLRAWCEKSQDYRDFVLSRFRGIPVLENDKTEHTIEKDVAWNTSVTIILKPDLRLSLEKQAVLENDYQMQNGELHVTTRGCLVQYLLREMQVSTKVLDGTPEAQQLICVNLPEIKKWLFE